MRKDIKIVALLLTANTLAVNGTLYKLFVNNCEGETTTKLIAMLVITILISFGLAFLMQKMGVRFNMKSKSESNPEK